MLDFLITPYITSNAQTRRSERGRTQQGGCVRPVASLYNTPYGVIRKTSSEAHDKKIMYMGETFNYQ